MGISLRQNWNTIPPDTFLRCYSFFKKLISMPLCTNEKAVIPPISHHINFFFKFISINGVMENSVTNANKSIFFFLKKMSFRFSVIFQITVPFWDLRWYETFSLCKSVTTDLKRVQGYQIVHFSATTILMYKYTQYWILDL